MIKGLSDYEKYKVLRPVIGEHQLDENGFPIINKTEYWCDRVTECIAKKEE